MDLRTEGTKSQSSLAARARIGKAIATLARGRGHGCRNRRHAISRAAKADRLAKFPGPSRATRSSCLCGGYRQGRGGSRCRSLRFAPDFGRIDVLVNSAAQPSGHGQAAVAGRDYRRDVLERRQRQGHGLFAHGARGCAPDDGSRAGAASSISAGSARVRPAPPSAASAMSASRHWTQAISPMNWDRAAST